MAILNSLPTKIGLATETSNGLMSSDDKKLVNKINRIEENVANKLNKNDKIKSSQLDTSSDVAKIQPENLSSEVKAMMTGQSPVDMTIKNKTLVTEYFADNAVTSAKRTANGSIAFIVSDDYCDFNTTGDTEVVLSIPSNYKIYFGAEVKTVTDTPEYINLTKGEASVIVYSKVYGFSAYTDTGVKEDDYIVGAFDGTYVTMFNGRYTVDGTIIIGDGSLDGSAIKDFSLDSKKIAIQHGIILSDKSKAPYLNANFTYNFIEVVKEFVISIADQYPITIKSRQECTIPENTLNKKYLYIYYDLGISKLNAIWASSDITSTILNNNEKLVLIGVITDKMPVGINRDFISIDSIYLRNTDIEYLHILSGNVVIDFSNKVISANNVKAFIDNELVTLSSVSSQTITLTDDMISDITNEIPYTLGAIRTDFNSNTYKLVFKKTSEIKSLGLEAFALTSIYKYDISHNTETISVIKTDGNVVKSNNNISAGYIFPFDDETIIAKLSTGLEDGVLFLSITTVPGAAIIDLSSNINYDITEELTYTLAVENLHGIYAVLYNTETGKIEAQSINNTINNKIYISLGLVYNLNDSLSYEATGVITNHITLNNNRPSNYQIISGPDPDKGYDWSNNRLVLPDDIYLLNNSQYSFYCQNMSMNRYIDNDYILYEIGLPNGSVMSENILTVNSPLVGDFESRIVGKFKGNNNCLFKDINLHFNVPEGKELSVLCIGDDTVDMNMPGYVKAYLTQLGYTPTMLGTQKNAISSNGYGMKNIEDEYGEGHKGWRITDFMCRTKHTDNSPYYIQNNPFMSNSKFDFEYYMTSNSYDKVDVVVISMGLNDITGYHTASAIESIDNLSISQNIEQLPNIYKEMITNIHTYDSDIKIIINPTMIKGIDDDFNKKSLLLTETLMYDLKNINNVFIVPGYLGQPLFVQADKTSIDKYSSYNDINNTKVGSSISSSEINGIAQSNLAYMIVSAIVGVTK